MGTHAATCDRVVFVYTKSNLIQLKKISEKFAELEIVWDPTKG